MADWFAPKKLPPTYSYSYKRTSQEFYEALSTGISKDAACAQVGCSVSQFYLWMKKYPEFAANVVDGLAAGKLAWERLGQNPNDEKFDANIYRHRLNHVYGEKENNSTVNVFNGGTQNVQSDPVDEALARVLKDSNNKDPFIESLEVEKPQ